MEGHLTSETPPGTHSLSSHENSVGRVPVEGTLQDPQPALLNVSPQKQARLSSLHGPEGLRTHDSLVGSGAGEGRWGEQECE